MAGSKSFFLDLRWRLAEVDFDEEREDLADDLDADLSFSVRMDAWCFRFLPRIGTGVRSIGFYASVVIRQQSIYMQCD